MVCVILEGWKLLDEAMHWPVLIELQIAAKT